MRRKLPVILILVVLACALSGCELTDSLFSRKVTVPTVTGRRLETAGEMLYMVGLKYQTLLVNSDDVSADFVMEQNPAADKVLTEGDTVMLTVSAGPARAEMPDLTGIGLEEAKTVLKSMGLAPDFERVINPDFPPDTVVSQKPAAGQQVDRNTSVSIRVSGGSAAVPDLVGRTLAEAEHELQNSRLTLNPVLRYVETQIAGDHGIITGQNPEYGQAVMEGTTVTLDIYRFPDEQSTYTLTFRLAESGENVRLRVTLQAGESPEYEAFSHTYLPEMDRNQEASVNLPDRRTYTVRIYQNGKVTDTFTTEK